MPSRSWASTTMRTALSRAAHGPALPSPARTPCTWRARRRPGGGRRPARRRATARHDGRPRRSAVAPRGRWPRSPVTITVAPPQPLDRHVPQPRRIAAVGLVGVEHEHERSGPCPVEHLEYLEPTGRVLAEEQAARAALTPKRSVAAVDLGHGREGGGGRRPAPRPSDPGGGQRHGRVGPGVLAGQVDVEGDGVGADEHDVCRRS